MRKVKVNQGLFRMFREFGRGEGRKKLGGSSLDMKGMRKL